MQGRDYKTFFAGGYYHIYNRGNNKQDIFLDTEDFGFFIYRLKENLQGAPLQQGCPLYRRKQLPVGAFSLICYCLMPNHFHLLLRQNTGLAVSSLIQKLSTAYAMYFNKKYSRVGHVWQDQYKAKLVNNDSYLLWLSAYIHLNPIVAGLVTEPGDYKWSSFSEYVGRVSQPLCEREIISRQFAGEKSYGEFVSTVTAEIIAKKELQHILLD